jgi:hypothetical protein
LAELGDHAIDRAPRHQPGNREVHDDGKEEGNAIDPDSTKRDAHRRLLALVAVVVD